MAKHWTKIRSDVVLSERMADLLDRNPLAYALFMNAKAACDDYGRLPASPRKFKGLTAPLTRYTPAKIEKAIQDMAACGVVALYSADGDDYLEIIRYNDVEETEWRNVGKPEYPAPPDWQPPDDLLEFIASATDGTDRKSRIYPERYGISADQFRALAEHRGIIARPSPDNRPTLARASESESESESEGNDSLGAREGGSEVGDNHPDDGFQDAHMADCNYPELMAAVADAQPRWGAAKQRAFRLDLIAAIEDPNTPVTRQEVMGWLATDGQRPSYADRGDSYLRRMIAKREAAKRDGVPDARADPILAAHIAKEGPRPLDAMAAMIWDRKLEEARGEVRQTA